MFMSSILTDATDRFWRESDTTDARHGFLTPVWQHDLRTHDRDGDRAGPTGARSCASSSSTLVVLALVTAATVVRGLPALDGNIDDGRGHRRTGAEAESAATSRSTSW